MSERNVRHLIGSMVMVGVRGGEPGEHLLERDLDVCAEAHVGGVILFDVDLPEMTRLIDAGVSREEARRRAGRNIQSPEQTRSLIAHCRARLGDDLIVAVDHEGGRTTRLSPERGFDTTVSAAEFAMLDTNERRNAAARLAVVARAAGMDLNCAPCVDLAVNAENPIIAKRGRAFGADAATVADCAAMIIDEHRRAGLMTCLKHFPGHGGTALDSHETLPDLTGRSTHDAELAPFRALSPRVDASTWIMTAHLLDRDIDPALPASLSKAHTSGVLRESLGFSGVIVTDSLDMGAVMHRWTIEESAVLAIQAGADVVLDGVNAPGPMRECPALRIVQAIETALKDGVIEGGEARLLTSVERIRAARRAARPAARR